MQHFMAGAQRQHLRGSLEHPRCLCCGGMGFTRDRVEMKTQMRLICWMQALMFGAELGEHGWVAVLFV